MCFRRRSRDIVQRFAPAVSGHILVRPADPGVRQAPPLPLAVELGQGVAPDPGLAERIERRIREALVVTTRVELLPWASLGRSEYKSKLIRRDEPNRRER